MKHRIVHALQKYVLNPPIRLLFALGIAPPGYALLETTGRKSGKPRRTPVGNGRIGRQFWIVAEHGIKAGYVLNMRHNPRVRLKLRDGLLARWHTGTAHVLSDDDPRERQRWQWLNRTWTDQYSGNDYKITTTGSHGNRHNARVKTYSEVLHDYEIHPESKCADARGKICGEQAVGLLQRRHVRIDQVKYIGKESNNLEEVEAGLHHSAENIYTEYPDPRRDEWQTKILPALKKIPLLLLVKLSAMSRSTLIEVRAGRSRPRRENRELLTAIVRKLGRL